MAQLPVKSEAKAAASYTLTELGVYASDPDAGEILYQVFRLDEARAITAGGDSSLVPRYAATMGMAPILAAKKCLLLACFAEQTAPLKAISVRSGAPTPFLPASYLWGHPDFRLVYTTDKITLK